MQTVLSCAAIAICSANLARQRNAGRSLPIERARNGVSLANNGKRAPVLDHSAGDEFTSAIAPMDILLIWFVLALLFLAIGYLHRARERRTAAGREVLSPEPLIGAETLADFHQRPLPVLAVAGYQVRDASVMFEGNLPAA